MKNVDQMLVCVPLHHTWAMLSEPFIGPIRASKHHLRSLISPVEIQDTPLELAITVAIGTNSRR